MSEIPRKVLSDEFHDLMTGRRLRAAVFLTFRFDPGFFEQEVLPAFLDVPLSHVPEIRLLNLAEALRQVDSIAVYYDRRGLVAGASSGKLDIQRVPVFHPTGYFHPKTVLALVEDVDAVDDGERKQRLVVAALSANLTRAGWWENVEAAHIEHVGEGEPCSFKADLRSLIARVRHAARHVPQHDALDEIDAFVRRLADEPQRMRGGVVLPRLFAGESVVQFLTDVAENRLQRCNLEVLSPYFDTVASDAAPLAQLKAAFRPREVRVYLPRGVENEALCSSSYYSEVAKTASWGTMPKDVMKLSKSVERTLHAKVYRFFDPDRDYEAFFVGSVNLTGPAFNRGGNVESGFFIESPSPRRLDWWMTVDKHVPETFIERREDEGVPQGRGWKLSVRFDWHTERGEAFWDDNSGSPPLTLAAHGVELGVISPLRGRESIDLDRSLNEALKRELTSSSFLTVNIAGEPDTEILVDEQQMTHKPSLMRSLSAADILRYWSLLTPEQKKEFLDEHAHDLSGDPELALWLGSRAMRDGAESFFSTFAEVYLSFGNLERAVRSAVAAKREREAVERLFGRKFDSLRRLIERIIEENDSDRVRRYVTLLCARQFLDVLEEMEPDFIAARREDVNELRSLLDTAATIREEFAFGSREERTDFFHWFERWFVRRAEAPEGVEA